MKIFFIDPQSYNNLAVYDFNLLSNMTDNVIFWGNKNYTYHQMPDNVESHFVFNYSKYKNLLLKSFSYMATCLSVFAQMLKHKPDVVHVQWLRLPAFDHCFYRLAKHCLKFKMVFTAHNVLPHNTGDKYKKQYNKFYHMVDHIIVHDQNSKLEIIEKFQINPDKISVIAHGLLKLEPDFKTLKKITPELERKYDTAGKLVFSSLGEQSRYKAVDLIVDVWVNTSQLRNNPNCKLLIVGKCKGIDLSSLEGLDNVVVTDARVSEEEFYYVMHHTDVDLLTYKTISQSGVLLTAMAEHVPVLVSDAGGLADPLKVAEVGWLIPQLSHQNLKDTLLQILSDPEKVRRIKQNNENWNKIEAEYSWEKISHTTQRLYHFLSEK